MSNPGCHTVTLRLSVLLAMVLSISFCNCGGEKTEPTEISFWAMGLEGESIQKLLPDFYREYPDIRVNVQMFPWTAAQEKLITAYASDNLPDAFQLGNTWIPQFVSLEALEGLDQWLSLSDKIDSTAYFRGIWKTNMIEGRLFGIPWYIDTRVIFYRTDILKEAGFSSPPTSWEELYQICLKIKELHGSEDKYAIYLPTNEWATFVIFGFQKQASLLVKNNRYANFSSKEFQDAFEYLIKFHKEGLAPKGISAVTNVYQAFATGYFAMYISGPWNIPEFKQWMTGDLEHKWMTAPLPGPGDNYPGVSLAGGSSLVINKKSNKKAAVWKFFEFLSDPEIQIRFYKLVSDLPAVKKAWERHILKDDPYMRAFFVQFHHVVPTPKIPEWEQIAFSKIQQYAEYAARGVMSTEAALDALDEDANHILEKRRWIKDRQGE